MKKLSSSNRHSSLTRNNSLEALQFQLDSLTAQVDLITRTDRCLMTIPTVARRLLASVSSANPSWTRQKFAESSISASLRCEMLMLNGMESLCSTLSLEHALMVRNALLKLTTLATLLTHNSPRGLIGCTNRLETSQRQAALRKVCTIPMAHLRLKSLKL